MYATDKGKVLITAIGDKILASPEMTAKWEQRLAEIGKAQHHQQLLWNKRKVIS